MERITKQVNISRREFLKLMGTGAAGVVLATAAPPATAAPAAPAATVAPTAAQPVFDYQRFKGQSIFVSLSKNPIGDLLASNTAEFEALTGIKAQVEVVPEQQLRQKVVIQMTSKSTEMDAWGSVSNERRMFGKAGWYHPLNTFLKDPSLAFPDLDLADFGKGAWDYATLSDGTIHGLPLQAPAIVLAYRKDLVDAKGLKLETLDDLEAAVKALHNPPTVYGFVGRGLKNANMAPLSTLIPNFGGSYLDKSRNLAMTSPEVTKAAEFYVRLMKHAPPGAVGFNAPECQASFMQGQSAFWIDGSDLVAVADNPEKSKVAGKVGYMAVPKGPGGQFVPSAGNAMAVNAFSKNKEAAFYYAQWATSKKNQVLGLLIGTPAARSSPWKDPEFLSKTTLPKSWIEMSAQVPSMAVGFMPEIVPVSQFRDVYGTALTKSIEGGNVAELFKAAQAEFEPVLIKHLILGDPENPCYWS